MWRTDPSFPSTSPRDLLASLQCAQEAPLRVRHGMVSLSRLTVSSACIACSHKVEAGGKHPRFSLSAPRVSQGSDGQLGFKFVRPFWGFRSPGESDGRRSCRASAFIEPLMNNKHCDDLIVIWQVLFGNRTGPIPDRLGEMTALTHLEGYENELSGEWTLNEGVLLSCRRYVER